MGTSGVIAVAKTVESFTALSQAFAQREVKKTYFAVAAGCRRAFRGHRPGGGYLIEHAIARSTSDRLRMATLPEGCGGRPASSLVRAVAEDREISLLEVRPRTGRTHQIRVHLAEEQAPVLGDPVYGAASANRRFAVRAQRPMLHAFSLAFQHPRTGEPVEFQAPLPADMRALVQRMTPAPGEETLFKYLLGRAEGTDDEQLGDGMVASAGSEGDVLLAGAASALRQPEPEAVAASA